MKDIVFASIESLERVARHASESGLTQHRKLHAAVTVLLTGRELGLGPMASLRAIHEVQGRPVLSADAMVALVRRSGLCESWHTAHSSNERCTITTVRRGEAEASVTWTMEDARRAGCTGPAWTKFPRVMLRHRAASELARMVYPDVILGIYSAEELDEAPLAGVIEATPDRDSLLRFTLAVEGMTCAEDAASTWLAHRDAIATLPREEALRHWEALVRRTAELAGVSLSEAADRVKSSLK